MRREVIRFLIKLIIIAAIFAGCALWAWMSQYPEFAPSYKWHERYKDLQKR